MKKILVIALSFCTFYAVGQHDKGNTKQAPQQDQGNVKQAPEQDNSSLDGKAFRITLKAKDVTTENVKTTETTRTQTPQNMTGVNTGTIKTDKNDTGYQHETKVDNSRVQTEVRDSVNVANGVMTEDKVQVTTEVKTDNHTQHQQHTATNTHTMEMRTMNNKTLTVSFNDGRLIVAETGADKDKSGKIIEKDKAEKSTERGMDDDYAANAGNDLFNSCNYNVTSGKSALSTFSSTCAGTTTGTRVYWNGFVNEGSISGNMVIYQSDGSSDKYTFTGKATRSDISKKPTSSR